MKLSSWNTASFRAMQGGQMVSSALQKRFPDSWVLFTDGASSGNPGPSGWAYIAVSPEGQVDERSGYEPQTTNNRMELRSAIEGLLMLRTFSPEKVWVLTDSTYLIRGATQWRWGWMKKGWKTQAGADVANRDLWEDLDAVLRALKNCEVHWGYIPGHAGYPGNERADRLAVSESQRQGVSWFRGKLDEYSEDLSHLPLSVELPEEKKSSMTARSVPAYYLSYVSGKLERHSTWSDCERVVKGRAGAKFKKISSEEEAAETLRKWGVPAGKNE